ncbi:MAG: cob(I)yrinic acid a,c-diamide adenosyltransferase [Dehalococcoidia bacterium]|nr:cob(I)yrinic acid a,c-diamide adenosyltransferase [Dehalococcoidia bacterium]
MSIVTKRGDTGETGLLYGGRVPKDDARVEAYGTVDEAVAALGLARSLSGQAMVRAALLALQQDLFVLAAEMAIDVKQYATFDKHFKRVTAAMVDRIGAQVLEIEAKIAMPPTFIVPGSSAGSAALDLARTIVRRAERRATGLQAAGLLTNGEIIRYLNRASDLVYSLARYETKDTDPEILAGRHT